MLTFERFRVTNAAGLSFDLPLRNRGLVRMLGPNGAGKSTCWHLFTQTHYGASPNGAKKTDFQFDEKVKDFLLESTFQKNNATYTAAHAVKSKVLSPSGVPYDSGVYLFRDGKDISLHKDPDTLNLVKQTMGWSLEEWYGYVYLAQSTTHALINGTRSTRQAYLSALFNLLPLDTLHKYCKDKSESYDQALRDLERDKQEHAIKIGLLRDRSLVASEIQEQEAREGIAFIEQQLKGLITKQAAWDRKQVLEQQLAGKQKPAKSVEELAEEIARLQQQEAAYKAALTRREKLEQELKALPVVLEPQVPADMAEVLLSPDQSQDMLSAEISKLEALQAKIRNLTAPELPADYQEVLDSPDLDEFQVRVRLKKLRERPAPPPFERPTGEQIAQIEEKVLKLSVEMAPLPKQIRQLEFGGSECDKCGTHLDTQHRAGELQEKREELEALQAAHAKAQKTLTDLKNKHQAWTGYDVLGPDETHEIPALEASVERFKTKKLYQGIKVQQEAYQKEQEAKQAVQGLPALLDARTLYRKKLGYQEISKQKENYLRWLDTKERLEGELGAIVLPLSVASDLSLLHNTLRVAQEVAQIETELATLTGAKDVSAKVETLKAEQNALQVKLGQLIRDIQDIKQLTQEVEKIGQAIESKTHLEQSKTKYALLTKGYGKAGQLRELQLKKFSNYLKEALLAHTIRQLPEHRFDFVVDDGIDIMTSKNGGTAYDVKFMSGGEKGGLSLAFLFALDDLLPPDRRSNLKIVDEIEAAFDVNRKQDFAQFTLPELRKRAETVVVISHAGAANQGMFDAYWKIENGTIVEVTPERREYEEEVTA